MRRSAHARTEFCPFSYAHLCPGIPRWNLLLNFSPICFCSTFHINVMYRSWNWCWQVMFCVCGIHFCCCVWVYCVALQSFIPLSLTQSWHHQSVAREASNNVSVWQRSSYKVQYFSLNTWSGIQHCWVIHAINSCASSTCRDESRPLEDKHHDRLI